MTERGMYEVALIEMNKVEAPSLLLEDYNYFMNKAVQQYINKVYNRYDINQQSSDDLRVLKATAEIQLRRKFQNRLSDNEKYQRLTSETDQGIDGKLDVNTANGQFKDKVAGNPDAKFARRKTANKDKFVYDGVLPADYMHILNCIVDFRVAKNFKCYRAGDYIEFAAKRLTADMASGILHNVYMKPDYKRPYFYINNVNTSTVASLADDGNVNLRYAKIDQNGNVVPNSRREYAATNSEMDSGILTLKDCEDTNPDGNRVANTSEVRIEIRFGDDDSVFVPEYVYIDYIKAPMFIQLTYDDITSTEDNTRVLEFPDYVCFEIVNEFVKLLMENASDPRLQTNYAINQTIGDPTVSNSQSQSKDKS